VLQCWMMLLVESCLHQHRDANVQHVHRCIAEYLKLAPFRVGGAGKRSHTASFVTKLEGAVAVTGTVDGGDAADNDNDEGEGDDGDSESDADDDDYDDGDAGDAELESYF